MNGMKDFEKHRIFQENLKKRLTYSDLVSLKSYFRFLFGKTHSNSVYLEFVSEKRVF